MHFTSSCIDILEAIEQQNIFEVEEFIVINIALATINLLAINLAAQEGAISPVRTPEPETPLRSHVIPIRETITNTTQTPLSILVTKIPYERVRPADDTGIITAHTISVSDTQSDETGKGNGEDDDDSENGDDLEVDSDGQAEDEVEDEYESEMKRTAMISRIILMVRMRMRMRMRMSMGMGMRRVRGMGMKGSTKATTTRLIQIHLAATQRQKSTSVPHNQTKPGQSTSMNEFELL